MAILHRTHKTDREIEKRLLTGLIISDKMISSLFHLLQPDTLELEVSKIVCKWIINYYSDYKQAPKGHIRDIFEAERKNLKQGLDEEIAQFLAKLSEEYLSSDNPEGINDDYLIDRAKEYLKERHLRKLATDLTSLLDIGRVEEAEKVYDTRKQLIQEASYKWSKPFDDPYFLNTVFEEADQPLFRLKGHLGDLIGDLHRGWLLAVMGPMKRGKTWSLQDIAFDAMLSRKRVAYISLEMKDKHLAPRIYKELGVFGDEGGDYIYPCFDCLNNQDGSCNKKIKINQTPFPKTFDPKSSSLYKPCSVCRKIESERKDFLAAVWYFVAPASKLTIANVRKELKTFQRSYGKNRLRLISFPAFSATLGDINDQLDELEVAEGFIPDVIITDYASIMAPEHHYNDPRHVVDEIFRGHKRMAQERDALVVTGAQSLGTGREALNKDIQDERDIGMNAYILAHLDILMVLDQTVEEKENGVWRMGVLEHRWRKFNKRRQVMALQQLELGQPVLDTEMIYWNSKKVNEDE